jgi:hypothetical protein
MYLGAKSGQESYPGAALAAMRCFRVSIDALRVSTDRYSKRMLWLTMVLMVLTAIQATIAIVTVLQWMKSGTP